MGDFLKGVEEYQLYGIRYAGGGVMYSSKLKHTKVYRGGSSGGYASLETEVCGISANIKAGHISLSFSLRAAGGGTTDVNVQISVDDFPTLLEEFIHMKFYFHYPKFVIISPPSSKVGFLEGMIYDPFVISSLEHYLTPHHIQRRNSSISLRRLNHTKPEFFCHRAARLVPARP